MNDEQTERIACALEKITKILEDNTVAKENDFDSRLAVSIRTALLPFIPNKFEKKELAEGKTISTNVGAIERQKIAEKIVSKVRNGDVYDND